MSSKEVSFYVNKKGLLIKVIENDGAAFLKKGAQRFETVVKYADYKGNEAAVFAVKEYEIKYNRKFDDGTLS